MYTSQDLSYVKLVSPDLGYPVSMPRVPKAVYEKRAADFTALLREKGLDAAVIYADREHYANFKYFTGVDPRFEEALLCLHADGRKYVALGNECLSLAQTSAIELQPVFCQAFSLPNQPMDAFEGMDAVVGACGIRAGMRLGCIDWKLIYARHGENYRHMYSMPAYIVEALSAAVGDAQLMTNETALLIDPEKGLRLIAEADAIAAFEYGATCASQSCVDMLNAVEPGMRECELANLARPHGQVLSCHEYVVAGPNTRRGLISPSDYVLKPGDDLVVSVGIEGGLTCRRCALSRAGEAMAEDSAHYLEEIVKPYMATVFNWFEMMGIGVCCGDIYDMVQRCLPKEKYGWTLNPGHMIGYEEWMCSPIARGSQTVIRSGMMFQMDIIPSDPACITPNAEDGLAIADEALRAELAQKYPEAYARIQARRKFAQEQLGLKLRPEVLPLSNCFGEYRPFALCRDMAIALKR